MTSSSSLVRYFLSPQGFNGTTTIGGIPFDIVLDTFHITKTSLITAAILCGTTIIVLRIIYIFYFHPLSKIPGPFLDTLFPIVVIVYHIVRGTVPQHFLKQHQKYGPVVRLGPNHVSIVTPADWKRLLSSHRFRKFATERINSFGAQNTFTTHDPELNMSRRRLMKPAFTTTHIAVMEQSILEAGPLSVMKKFDEAIRQKESDDGGCGGAAKVNYVDSFHYMTFDVIGELAFGQSFGMLQKGDLFALDGIKALNTLGIFEVYVPLLSKYKELLVPSMIKKINRLKDFTKDVVAKRKKQTASNSNKSPSGVPQDILQVFINNTDQETKAKLKEKDLISELIVQLFGGTDTSSNTLSWTLFLLMVYPETYKKVCREIRSTFPDRSKPITYTEGLSKLPYLEAVIYESMRFLPTTSGRVGRKVPEQQGFELSTGQYLPPGTEVSVPIYSIHHDGALWKDHHVFIPERFLASEKEGNSVEDVVARKKNLMTFSTGVRVCPGRNLAMCEIFMTLANILRDYDFWLPEDMVEFGPDVIDDETGEPRIIPGFLGITYTPRYSERDGWICVKHNVASSQ